MGPQSWWVESITNAEILSRGEELPPIDDETECSDDED